MRSTRRLPTTVRPVVSPIGGPAVHNGVVINKADDRLGR